MLLIRHFIFTLLLVLCSLELTADEYETFTQNGKYGLKNTTSGEVIIPPQYESIGWSDGSFKVINNTIGARQNEKWALINLDGTKISAHKYANLTPYLDNLFIASKRENKSILTNYGIINGRGKVVIDLSYAKIEPVNNLLIATKRIGQTYRYGTLNKNGRTIIPFEYRFIEEITDGFLIVENNEKLSAIFRMDGRAITEFQFESVEELTEELFLVTLYNKRGLLDNTGALVLPPIYKSVQLSGQKVRVLPFKKWDFYEEDEFQKTFYFDKMQMVDETTFAITSGRQTGLVDREERYEEYLSKLNIVTSIDGITIVKDSESSYQGAMNASGKIVLPATYDSVTVVNELLFGQIRRMDKQGWKVFDRSGKRKNPFNHEALKALKNGLIEANRNGKKGLLNSDGSDLSAFVYNDIGEFRNGLAVASYQGSYGVIDTKGNWVITPYNDQIEILGDIIRLKQGSEWKLVDLNGRELIRSYNKLFPLPIGHGKKSNDGFAIYDANYSLWLEHTYDSIQVIHEDLYSLNRDGLFFFFKPSDELSFALDSGVIEVGQFSEGLIPVLKDGQWGQVDEEGKLRIANRYEAIQSFYEDLAGVKLIGKWGFINKKENLIVQPIYDQVSPFHKGLSVTLKDGKYGLINQSGKLILAEDFTSIDRHNDYIILNSNGVFGLADAKGKLIRSPQYDRITALTDNYFLIERDGLKGVINLSGKDVIPLSYEAIEQMGDRFLASEPSEWELIDIK